jgi:beta-xylosidase
MEPTPREIAGQGNPIIRYKFTADPTVLVHKDILYLYTGHDTPPDGVEDYAMNNWLCFSSADLVNWKEHPSPLKATDFSWAKGNAYASKVVEKENKFYWYAAVSHGSIAGMAIGVAVADRPTGPFKDAKGFALISHDMIPPTANQKANLDPTAIIDENGQAYLIWGNQTCYIAKLKNNMIAIDGPISTISLPAFSEGAHIHRNGDWYYLSYGYGMPEKIGYAMSRNINGPWTFTGILNEVPENCETNRPAIIDFKGKSYLFYHNGTLKGGGSHRRSICIDYLQYNQDGTIIPVIMTTAGVKKAAS